MFVLFCVFLFMAETIGQLLFQLPLPERKLFRDLENNELKIVRSHTSQKFNTCCIKEGLLPNYTNLIYLSLNNYERRRQLRNENDRNGWN